MNVLLDTHLLIWLAEASPRLPDGLETRIMDLGTPAFSVVSIWEIAIKTRLGRPDFRVDPKMFRDALLANGYAELPVGGDQAAAVVDLPVIHNDPFDRLLVAQAKTADLVRLTSDRKMAAYGRPVQLVRAVFQSRSIDRPILPACRP